MKTSLAASALLSISAATSATWLFPGRGAPEPASAPEAPRVVRLPGSDIAFRESDLHGMSRAIDWFPASHPPPPDIVLRQGPGDAYPCGYCHLANGRGRPENARLQGLPAAYIVTQVKAFASGARRSPAPGYIPTQYMTTVAHAVSASDLAAAANYFSGIEPGSTTRVVEAATIPQATAWKFVYRFDPMRREPLGQRIVEGPVDPERFEFRDPETPYTAYVPEGAIARGRLIAERGLLGAPPCESCHGRALAGFAGASPSYLARQLMGFRAKTRDDPEAEPMQAVAARMTDAQIIDAAAYAASLRPWSRAELAAASAQK